MKTRKLKLGDEQKILLRMAKYSVTRQQIVEAARELIRLPFVHQGRSDETGADCVGILKAIAEKIGYPYEITDKVTYKRVPSYKDLLEHLRANMKEIKLSKVGVGDVILMRPPGSRQPMHVAICSSTESDSLHGKEPMMIHALNNGEVQRVVEQPQRIYKDGFVKGFRVKGLKG